MSYPNPASTNSGDIEKDTVEDSPSRHLGSAETTHHAVSKHRWAVLRRRAPSLPPGEPPDGGITAWLQVLAGHLICFISWGLVASYGVFQTEYRETLPVSDSEVSWIGSIQLFLLLFVGPLSGRASDAGFVREVVLVATVFIVLGVFMASLSTKYYQLFLAQGLCAGVGMGILVVPGLAVASSYFKHRKSVALAIITSGAGTGGVVYPAMAQQLLPKVGLGWTLRSMGLVTMIVGVVINLILRARVAPRKAGPLIEVSAFAEPSYLAFTSSYFLIYWAVYFAFYYIDSYGNAFAHFTSTDSINLLLITNALGIPGRVLAGFVADRFFGPLNTAVSMTFVVAAILFCWIAVGDSRSGLYTFAAIYGFFAAGVQGFFAAGLASLTEDPSKLGVRIGMAFGVVSFATLTGSPIAGALIQANNGRYLGAQLWAGFCMLLAGGGLSAGRVLRTGRVWTVRA